MSDDDDKVGYGKPPRKHRFRPGESGNRKGRPRKLPQVVLPRQIRESFLEVANRIVEVRTPKGVRKVPFSTLVFEALTQAAMKGKPGAFKHGGKCMKGHLTRPFRSPRRSIISRWPSTWPNNIPRPATGQMMQNFCDI